MNYKFPVIEHIDQIREAIKGREEFIEADRGDYIVFNYLVAYTDSFPSIGGWGQKLVKGAKPYFYETIADEPAKLRRECRGLIFDSQGKILSRRFHKFFNMGEREETLNPDLTQEHVILEKLDGSMITPLMLPSGLKWATKMGVTDIGLMCENYVNSLGNSGYKNFGMDMYSCGLTPIFEFMSPQTRIVLDHSKESLVLIAMRYNNTGSYVKYENLLEYSKLYNIPVVQPMLVGIHDVKNLSDTEGIVVCFTDGHKLKVKTDWYCAIHKMKENLLFEKNVIKLILEDKVDDILPAIPEADKNKLNEYKDNLLQNVQLSTFIISQKLAYYEKTLTKKDYAIMYAPRDNSLDRIIIFSCWNNDKDISSEIIKYMLKHTGSQKEVDSIRYLLPEKW